MSAKKTDKFELLTQSALKVFAEKGFHNTKIKDITDNASLAAGTFYLYFKNKEELLEAIFNKYVGASISQIEDIANSDLKAEEKLDRFLKDGIDFWSDHKDFFNIYFEQVTCETKVHPFKCHIEMKKRINNALENIIKQGQEDGTFNKNIDKKILTLSIRGMMIMPMMQMQFIDPSIIFNKDIIYKTISQTIFKGIKNEG